MLQFQDASLTFNVTEGSAYDFNLYNMRRAWVEGTNNDAAGSGASWTYYDAGINAWGTAGAMNTTSDRYDTDLWDATSATFGPTGSVVIPLNASGIAAVQGWISTPANNFGLTIQYMGTGTDPDYWIVDSREATTEANRPKLNLTYCLPGAEPTINTSGTLTAFNTETGVPSAAQTYTVSGSNLTTGISITAPTGFELSTDGSSYSSNLTLAQSGGSVEATTIYVRLNSATEGTFSGNITHTSGSATQVDVPVSGVVTTTVPTCYLLTLTHTGQGSDPTASPTNSAGCSAGQYVANEVITLTAAPASGWQVGSWTGTDNNSSTATTNTVTMPAAARAASVVYTEIPPSQLVCESFDAFTTCKRSAHIPDGMLPAAGPTVTASAVAWRVRSAWVQHNNIYNWTAHPFNWNDADFQKIVLQQDFQSRAQRRV